MTQERQANCKECGEVYSYSLEWAEALAAQGRQPPEYCPRCRAIHALEHRSVAMPYFTAKPTGPRRPDQELSPGRLGRLTHFDRDHRSVSIPAKFHLPDSDIEFGIKDEDILELIEIVQQHQVTVVVGPTGSGKSTFLPYRLMVPPAPHPPDLFTRYGQIVVTQPRIQATRSIPAFVARDLHGCTLGAGGDVGYVHRGERAADRHTKLVYCTDGTLINWIASGRIADFSTIMIDEAHERSLNIDVILGLLRMRLPLYPDLKLIIASATIDADLFLGFFGGPGKVGFKDFKGLKLYDYQTCFRAQPVSTQPRPDEMAIAVADEVIRLLHEIARGQRASCQKPGEMELAPEGDILAFLPTVSSIDKAAATIRARIKEVPVLSGRDIQVHTLHRQLPLEVQDLALQKKSKAVASKVLQILQDTTENEAGDGDILALLLDRKSAEETATKLAEAIAETPALAGTAVGLSSEDAIASGWSGSPRHTVIVTTHDDVSQMDRSNFRHVVHDRRVVISTNIAETSLTVDGIVYVVDSGLILRPQWDLETLTQSYKTGWHSQDGCKQRWGRAGRVRDGYAHCLYTQAQFKKFDEHTLPEILRAPLEAVVLTAKRAGVDDVLEFPWIQPPDPKELERAIQALQERGLLDEDEDLTEHGEVVGQFGEGPNTGHLLVLADQFACAVEVATLIPMLKLRLRGGLLRWHHQWDGHTRRAVRLTHEGLMAGCRDDIAFLLKVYHAWSEAWRPEFNWLTDEPFRQLWPDKAPAPTAEMIRTFGETAMAELAEGARRGRSEEDLKRLVDHLSPNPLAEGWLNQAVAAMRDARRAAWARRFFVNHPVLVEVESKRQEILERLSIGKKEVEARPLEFDRLLDRVRLVMAYAWSDQVYQKQDGRYQAVSPRSRELEKDFLIEISYDSILSGRNEPPDAFVCGKRAAGTRRVSGQKPQTMLYVGLLAALDPAWLPVLQLPLIELAQWMTGNLRRDDDDGQPGEGFYAFLDQHYPLRGRYACRAIGPTDSEEIALSVGELLSPPPLIEETTPEGRIVWAEEIAEGIANDLDEQAGVDPDVKAVLDPEAEDPLAGLEVEETPVDDDEVSAEALGRSDGPSRPTTALPPAIGYIPAHDLPDPADQLPAQVTGYDADDADQPRLRLRHAPDPGAFERFAARYQVGDVVEVVATEVEQAPGDDHVALVVEVPDCGLEVVMEPTDLSFAGRYEPVKVVQPGARFQAVIEEIVPRTGRVYLSCLPLLEKHVPQAGEMLEGIVSETTESGVHISLLSSPPGLPVPLGAYAASEDVPQSIRQHGEGDSVTMRVDFEPHREKRLAGIAPALEEPLKHPRWEDHVGWDAAGHKLWVRGRLTNDERIELRAHTDDPHCRRAINELYRLSNQMKARVSMADILATYARHIQPGATVTATVVKVWKQEVLLSLADGVRARIALDALRKALRSRVDRGQKVEVVVESIEPDKGFVEVRLPSRAERLLQRYPPGSVHEGQVTRIERYGAFIKLEPTVQGLVQAKDLSWCKVIQPAQMVQAGDQVTVRVLRVRPNGKMDLTMRIEENKPELRYPKDSQVRGEVIKLRPYGALVRLGPGVMGMIHISELAWKRINKLDQVIGLGQKLTVRVLNVHGDPRKLDLSLKKAFRIYMRIPKNRIGTLIGRKGRTVKSIKAETDTEIRVGDDGVVTIWGARQRKVAAAQARIRALIPEAETIVEDE